MLHPLLGCLKSCFILEEVDDPNSTEEKSNKSEIVVSDESDSEIQVIVS